MRISLRQATARQFVHSAASGFWNAVFERWTRLSPPREGIHSKLTPPQERERCSSRLLQSIPYDGGGLGPPPPDGGQMHFVCAVLSISGLEYTVEQGVSKCMWL